MVPEQLLPASSADARSDVWALGAILHELITGERAFDGASEVQTAAAVLTAAVRPLRELAPSAPEELEVIVARCLALDPERRYADARALRAALSSFLG